MEADPFADIYIRQYSVCENQGDEDVTVTVEEPNDLRYDSDDGSDLSVNPDDFLSPVAKLEKYAYSGNIFNRQVVARSILETLRAVLDTTPEDVNAVLDVMSKLSDDSEPTVRAELMEQVPHIAMFCQEYRRQLVHVISTFLIPMIVKYLTDSNSQVRKTSQAALLVVVEQRLVGLCDVEEQVCPVLLKLTEAEPMDDYRTEAVALMSKLAPLLGSDPTCRLFLERFSSLCTDAAFHVRKVCATNFGDFCSVIGQEHTERELLQRFYYLCEDGIWGVRKACAESFMAVSESCSLLTRKKSLAPVFVKLLQDQSRWVRTAAFQALGPFISTFAESSISEASSEECYNSTIGVRDPGGTIDTQEVTEGPKEETTIGEVEGTPEQEVRMEQKLEGLEERTEPEEHPKPSIDDGLSMIEDRLSALTKFSESSVITNDNSSDCDLLCESACQCVPMDVVQSAENAELGPVDTEVSLEERRAEVYLTQKEGATDTGSQKSAKTETDVPASSNLVEEDFSSFHYWRTPIPDIPVDLDSLDEESSVTKIHTHISPKMHDEIGHKLDSLAECLESAVEMSSDSDDEVSHLETLTGDDQDELTRVKIVDPKGFAEIISSPDESKEMSKTDSSKAPLSSFVFRNPPKPGFVDLFSPETELLSSPSVLHVDDSFSRLEIDQDIVPQSLIEHYTSMIDPHRAQNVDNEIARHCAYSLPAVAFTLGRQNWLLLKETYEALASDMQWKVRRTLASSLHELAVILGEELATSDLLPVFNGLIKDVDEVRIGVLRHLADFLKILKATERRDYLPKLNVFLNTDNKRNWRFRLELAEQLFLIVQLFSPSDVLAHLVPIALELASDSIAEVRHVALRVLSAMTSHLCSAPDPSLVRELLTKLCEEFAHSNLWLRRLTFAKLCGQLAADQALPPAQFAQDVLPHLLDLATDKVPNVRIVVARVLTKHVLTLPYFSSSRSPHQEIVEQVVASLREDTDRDVQYYAGVELPDPLQTYIHTVIPPYPDLPGPPDIEPEQEEVHLFTMDTDQVKMDE